MIEDAVKIHDKTQFEIKLNYKFEKKKKDASYEVETYFFLPNSLGVNRHTLRKVNFYDGVQNYIRLKTPVYNLEQICKETESPFVRTKNTYEILAEKNNEQTIELYEYQTKMFANIFAAAIRRNTYFVQSLTKIDEIPNIILRHINSIREISVAFRSLKSIITIVTVDEEERTIHSFADEYLSLLIEKYTFKLLEYLKRSNITGTDVMQNGLLELIKDEVNYRKKNNYTSISNEKSDNEEFMFRFSVLKKYFESVLFLDANREKEGWLLEQVLFGIAAGLAMLFATAIAFFSQSIYGSLTMQLFVVLVISYIFKDRIKELMRFSLTKRVFKFLYDDKTILFVDKRYKVGIIRGSFNFMKWKNLSKLILSIRKKYRSKIFDNKFSEEKIILFKKKISLYPKFYNRMFKELQIDYITDIFRFDVSTLTRKMDNPRKPIFTLTPDGYKKTLGRRVYHVNLIIKYVEQKNTILHRFRLILTRNGIKRIEPVTSETY
ncbi:MAG: hypothetical protein ABFS12_06650 [Bacteroidota bacterium]